MMRLARHSNFQQQNLTKARILVDNGREVIPSKMGLGKLGSSLGALAIGAAVSAMPAKAEAQEVTRNDTQFPEVTPVTYEIPATVQAALDEYRSYLEEAAAVTTPEIIPDRDVRELGFNVLAEQCEEGRELNLENIAIKQRIAETDRRIAELTEQAMQDILESIDL